jgi:hypothetical protein
MLGIVIMKPDAGQRALERAASLPDRMPRYERACAIGEPPLSDPFAPIEDVLSISPLGAVTAPGEPLPTPYIRINTKKGANAFERKTTTALAPARIEITAIERRVNRDSEGNAVAESWTVRFKPCEKVALYYDDLDSVDPSILARAGGLKSFLEIGGPDHIARETYIKVDAGDVVGKADGFDVGLQDLAAAPAATAEPERYRSHIFENAAVFDAPPSLLRAISTDHPRARCAIDYLPEELKAEWAGKLGDSWGMRRVKGDNACRAALVDVPGTAQGAWFTDASHNALTNKISAIALAPDAIDPSRMIFALHGRLASLTPDMVVLAPGLESEKEAAARDFLTFEEGDGRINPAFGKVKEGEIYCYERLRANFVGPKISGVLLLEMETADNGAALLSVEARPETASCADFKEWSFTDNKTTFYR